MPISTYALVSVDEIKTALGGLSGIGMDALLESIANRVSDVIELYLGLQVVTRGSLTEYHSLDTCRPNLFLTQYPVSAITTVKEGLWSAGTWVPSLTLVAGTDYIVDKPSGKLVRLASGSPGSWAVGFEAVQVVYAAGVATTAAVPGAIKDIALAVACRKFQENQRGGGAAQQVTDALGTTMRFLPSELLRIEREALSPLRAWDYATTGRVA